MPECRFTHNPLTTLHPLPHRQILLTRAGAAVVLPQHLNPAAERHSGSAGTAKNGTSRERCQASSSCTDSPAALRWPQAAVPWRLIRTVLNFVLAVRGTRPRPNSAPPTRCCHTHTCCGCHVQKDEAFRNTTALQAALVPALSPGVTTATPQHHDHQRGRRSGNLVEMFDIAIRRAPHPVATAPWLAYHERGPDGTAPWTPVAVVRCPCGVAAVAPASSSANIRADSRRCVVHPRTNACPPTAGGRCICDRVLPAGCRGQQRRGGCRGGRAVGQRCQRRTGAGATAQWRV